MGIKVDLEKAYDCLYWDFIRKTLCLAGLPEQLILLIMNCIMTPSMQVMWEGEASYSFRPTRRIHQGDFLSPYYLFFALNV